MKKWACGFSILVMLLGCQQAPPASPKARTVYYVNTFTTLAKINAKFAALAKNPPKSKTFKLPLKVTYSFLKGTSLCGNKIPVITITDAFTATRKVQTETNGEVDRIITKKELLFVSGLHMDEATPPEVMMQFVDLIVKEYETSTPFRDDLAWVTIHIVPILNVDAKSFIDKTALALSKKARFNGDDTRLAQFGSGIYRKNFKRALKCKTETDLLAFYGVDLNRNFDANWNAPIADTDLQKEVIVATKPKYRGPFKASEVEVKALQSFIVNKKENLALFLDLHDKQGPEISATKSTIDNKKLYGILTQNQFVNISNTNVKPKEVNTTAKPYHGTSEHFAALQKIPYTIGIEIGTRAVPNNKAYITSNGKALSNTFLKLCKQVAAEHRAGTL